MHTHLCYEGLTRHYKNYPGYEGVEGAVADALAQHAAAVTAAQQQASPPRKRTQTSLLCLRTKNLLKAPLRPGKGSISYFLFQRDGFESTFQ
jgi:hypothetical protein